MADGSPLNPYEVRQSSDWRPNGDRDLSNLTVVATILLAMAMLTLAVFVGSLAFNLALGIGFDAPPGWAMVLLQRPAVAATFRANA